MNVTDKKILALLKRNSRTPVSELARKVGVSRITVQKRIDLLEASGEILGYTLLTKSEERTGFTAWMSIAIEGRNTSSVIDEVRIEREVNRAYTTNGRWDILVEIHSESLLDFDGLLGRIRKIKGVVSSETSILLTTQK